MTVIMLLPAANCFGQQNSDTPGSPLPTLNGQRSYNIGDSSFILAGNCKSIGFAFFGRGESVETVILTQSPAAVSKPAHTPFIQVHGNLLYNFDYRSYIDTPFAQNDLMQHLVQSTFNLLLQEKYPVKMIVTSRTNNSPYFKNTFDVSLQFNRSQILDNIKTGLRNQLLAVSNDAKGIIQKGQRLVNDKYSLADLQKLVNLDELKKYEEALRTKKMQLKKLQTWINEPARVQALVEEREKQLRSASRNSSVAHINTLTTGIGPIDDYTGKQGEKILNKGNALFSKTEEKVKSMMDSVGHRLHIDEARAQIDSVRKLITKLEDTVKNFTNRLKKEQKKITDSVYTIRQEINSLTTGPGLYAFMKKHNLGKGQLTKAQRILLSVNQVGIGRNWVDYSELTVKNISLAGINIEMNPVPVYVAAAAGRVNYRFRDFIYKNKANRLPPQSVALVRFGVGQKEKNNFILTFYEGKKTVLNPSGPNAYNARQKVYGISAEARLSLNVNNYIVAEFAKSSYYGNAGPEPSKAELRTRTFDFKERSNEAYSIKLFGQYPKTNTRFSAYYKKLGEHFQSFTLYPTGVNQEAWMAKLNQQLWKKRLSLEAAIRHNDFVSPVATPSYNSKAVFKSFQVTVRVPRYPFVSVGYYPSSQLLLNNNNVLMESQYNTLNAVVSHNYMLARKISMNTTGVFTKFFNSGPDTGFIYFNASSYTINHSIFFSRLQLLSGLTVTNQQLLHLLTLEQSLSYQMRQWFSLSAGLKWTRENHERNLLGLQAGLNMYLKKIGTLQVHYEKTYLPTANRQLKPVDMGNFGIYREF